MSSWGRLSKNIHSILNIDNRFNIPNREDLSKTVLAYGMGRSYGDICLNPGNYLWNTRGLDRFIELDDSTGILKCETGVLLRDIQRLCISRGWILPVTPGTQLITVGGAVANDVHGKNHHMFGSFGNHIRKIILLRTDGGVIECGPENNADWFSATVGGMGLTGLILEVEIQLRSIFGPMVQADKVNYESLEDFFELANQSESDWEHTVSWFDCNSDGRGLFIRGNYLDETIEQKPSTESVKKLPELPFSLVNKTSVNLFNKLYYALGKRGVGKYREHYEKFLYPLDGIENWNNIYGPKGFYQYQCVIPKENGLEAVKCLMKEISKSQLGSFLSVLKTFGNIHSLGMLSFPIPGVTLALDFTNHDAETEKLFLRLDKVVMEAGGRLYLAKDSRMSREFFELTYPNLTNFIRYRDPGISSAMSRRLMGN